MKLLGITQRVETVKGYSERRDCLDQRWYTFANALGYIAVPLPNITPELVPDLLARLSLDAVLLSGGNSIASFDPTANDAAPERDAFESMLIDHALAQNIPLIAVCRGMQMINVHLGGKLVGISGHVAVRHEISACSEKHKLPHIVNSYHNWCIPEAGLADNLEAIALDSSNNIEAYRYVDKKVVGIMWHPEREESVSSLDVELIRSIIL